MFLLAGFDFSTFFSIFFSFVFDIGANLLWIVVIIISCVSSCRRWIFWFHFRTFDSMLECVLCAFNPFFCPVTDSNDISFHCIQIRSNRSRYTILNRFGCHFFDCLIFTFPWTLNVKRGSIRLAKIMKIFKMTQKRWKNLFRRGRSVCPEFSSLMSNRCFSKIINIFKMCERKSLYFAIPYTFFPTDYNFYAP